MSVASLCCNYCLKLELYTSITEESDSEHAIRHYEAEFDKTITKSDPEYQIIYDLCYPNQLEGPSTSKRGRGRPPKQSSGTFAVPLTPRNTPRRKSTETFATPLTPSSRKGSKRICKLCKQDIPIQWTTRHVKKEHMDGVKLISCSDCDFRMEYKNRGDFSAHMQNLIDHDKAKEVDEAESSTSSEMHQAFEERYFMCFGDFPVKCKSENHPLVQANAMCAKLQALIE